MKYSILCLERKMASLRENVAMKKESNYRNKPLHPPFALTSSENEIEQDEKLIVDIATALKVLHEK